MDIPGWKITTTGWNVEGEPGNGVFRRGFMLMRSFERYSGSYVGAQDDAAFEAFVRAKVAALS